MLNLNPENNVGKGENADNQHFSPFLYFFQNALSGLVNIRIVLMLHAIYQSCSPYGMGQEDFLRISLFISM